MARTPNGNLRGRAAATYCREQQRDAIDDLLKQKANLRAKLGNAMADLKFADPDGWEAWYDLNVPEFRMNDCDVDNVVRILQMRVADQLNARAQRISAAIPTLHGEELMEANEELASIADMLDDDGEFPLALRFVEGEVFEVYPHRSPGEIPF